jgi:hypothetical protein
MRRIHANRWQESSFSECSGGGLRSFSAVGRARRRSFVFRASIECMANKEIAAGLIGVVQAYEEAQVRGIDAALAIEQLVDQLDVEDGHTIEHLNCSEAPRTKSHATPEH